MNDQLTPDLLPKSKKRNRLLLAVSFLFAAPLMVMGTGVFDRHHQPGPLLTMLGEVSVQRDVAVQTVAVSDQVVPMPPAHMDARTHVTAENMWPMADHGESGDFDLDPGIRWFNGRPVRPARTLTMVVTAYSPDERSCGEFADGVTASGYSVWTNAMKLAAADPKVLPFGSLISVPGYDNGEVIPVLDRGGAIKGRRLDMLYPTHEQARRWGTQRLTVTVWEYADGKPNDFKARFNSALAVRN
jgi:3D (Asp-Asp-Asp) domain-containing protein